MLFNRVFVIGVMLISMYANAMHDNQIVTLQSLDKQKFQVEVGVAKFSETIKNLLQDAEITVPLDLPNIRGATLATILELLRLIKIESNSQEAQTYIQAKLSSLSEAELIEFIAAVNFLDIPQLLQASIAKAEKIDLKKLPLEQFMALPKELRNKIISRQAMRNLGDITITAQATEVNDLEYVDMCLLTPDGQKLLVAFFGNGIGVFDVKTGNNLAVVSLPPLLLERERKIARAMYVTPDNSKLIVCIFDEEREDANFIEKIYVCDLVSYKVLSSYSLDVGVNVNSLFVTQDSSKLIAGLSDSLIICDLASGRQIGRVMYPPTHQYTQFGRFLSSRTDKIYGTKDGSQLICSTTTGQIYLYDMKNFQLIKKFEMSSLYKNYYFATTGMCVSHDESKLFMLLHEQKAQNDYIAYFIIEVDLISGDYRKIIDLGNGYFANGSFTVAPDGSKLIVANGVMVQIWDIAFGTLERKLTDGYAPYQVVVTPDGNTIISAEGRTRNITGSFNKGRLIKWDISLYNLMTNYMQNMSREQAQAVLKYLQGNHAAGWDGLKQIFSLPTAHAITEASGGEPVLKKHKAE